MTSGATYMPTQSGSFEIFMVRCCDTGNECKRHWAAEKVNIIVDDTAKGILETPLIYNTKL